MICSASDDLQQGRRPMWKGTNPHSQVQGVEEENQVFPLEIIQAQLFELPVNNGRSFKKRGVLCNGWSKPRRACGGGGEKTELKAAGRASSSSSSSRSQPQGRPGPAETFPPPGPGWALRRVCASPPPSPTLTEAELAAGAGQGPRRQPPPGGGSSGGGHLRGEKEGQKGRGLGRGGGRGGSLTHRVPQEPSQRGRHLERLTGGRSRALWGTGRLRVRPRREGCRRPAGRISPSPRSGRPPSSRQRFRDSERGDEGDLPWAQPVGAAGPRAEAGGGSRCRDWLWDLVVVCAGTDRHGANSVETSRARKLFTCRWRWLYRTRSGYSC